MAVIEEYNEEAERAVEEKKRAQERRKAAAGRGTNLGPKGPSLEKVKPTGFARGFLNPERTKEGSVPEPDLASEAGQSQGSASPNNGLSGEQNGKEGTRSAGHNREEERVANDEMTQNAGATTSSHDREHKREGTPDQDKSDGIKATPKGFAKGFLNPQAKQLSSGTRAEPQNNDMPFLDTSQKVGASSPGKENADRSKEEPGGKKQTATVRSDTAAQSGKETDRDPPSAEMDSESRPCVPSEAGDTWSTESQPSETTRSELQDDSSPGSVPHASGEQEASALVGEETREQTGGSQEGGAHAQSHEAPAFALAEQAEREDQKSAAAEAPKEEDEDEFHDACEDEEQQRQQALARAEEARLRGNALYAAGEYQGALHVYSQALELAPPAYIPVDRNETGETEQAGAADGQERTSEESAAGANGRGDAEKNVDSEEVRTETGSGVDSVPNSKGPKRVRPPKVLDPKTGKLVVSDQEEEALMSPGAKEGGARKEELPDEEALNCRAACHANRAACFVQLELHDAVVQECNAALKLKPEYVKVLVRRAQASDKLDKQEDALADWRSVLEKDPSHRQARSEIRRLEPIVTEKRERMKDEMLGKLKDLGNSVLGHFGLSVDNFKAVKDPNTGGYSINFSK